MVRTRINFDTPTDRLEAAQNRKVTQAMDLLHRIVEDLNPSSFTLKEIKESFNTLTKKKKSINKDRAKIVLEIRWGQSHLDILEKNGYIAKNDDDSYRVIKEPDRLKRCTSYP